MVNFSSSLTILVSLVLHRRLKSLSSQVTRKMMNRSPNIVKKCQSAIYICFCLPTYYFEQNPFIFILAIVKTSDECANVPKPPAIMRTELTCHYADAIVQTAPQITVAIAPICMVTWLCYPTK